MLLKNAIAYLKEKSLQTEQVGQANIALKIINLLFVTSNDCWKSYFTKMQNSQLSPPENLLQKQQVSIILLFFKEVTILLTKAFLSQLRNKVTKNWNSEVSLKLVRYPVQRSW